VVTKFLQASQGLQVKATADAESAVPSQPCAESAVLSQPRAESAVPDSKSLLDEGLDLEALTQHLQRSREGARGDSDSDEGGVRFRVLKIRSFYTWYDWHYDYIYTTCAAYAIYIYICDLYTIYTRFTYDLKTIYTRKKKRTRSDGWGGGKDAALGVRGYWSANFYYNLYTIYTRVIHELYMIYTRVRHTFITSFTWFVQDLHTINVQWTYNVDTIYIPFTYH
jgi:hypothetical protein